MGNVKHGVWIVSPSFCAIRIITHEPYVLGNVALEVD